MARPLNDRLPVSPAERLAEIAVAPRDAWRELADNALVPAAGSGPEWLGALLETMGGKAHLLKVASGSDITGMMAVEVRDHGDGYPARVAASWHTDLTFAGTPLIAAENPDRAFAGIIDAARRECGAHALIINGMEDNEALLAAVDAAGELGVAWRRIASHQRAALRPAGASYEAWLEASFSRKKRKEFRRLKARLGETGTLSFDALEPGEPVTPWIEDFLALEQAGWKGRRGTAVAGNEILERALRVALEGLAAHGDLGFWKLAVDGRPVAMLFAVMSGDRAWPVKIAHDEAFARFSPGSLIILEATRELMRSGRFSLVDSCAVPGHPQIESLWRDRIGICDIMIATPGTPGWLFALLVATERSRHTLRAVAKKAFYAATRRTIK